MMWDGAISLYRQRISMRPLRLWLVECPTILSASHNLNSVAHNMRMPNKRPGADAGWPVLFAFLRHWPRTAQAERSVAPLRKFPRNLLDKCHIYMKTIFNLSVLTFLLVTATSDCFA